MQKTDFMNAVSRFEYTLNMMCSESSNMCINTPERLDPQITKQPIQALCQTTSLRKMNKSYIIELENNLSHIKITTTAENKRQRLREERCKHKDNT